MSANFGSSATSSRPPCARAATGRSHILKFEGGYHGHADNLLVQFMNIQLPSGAEEGCLVYGLDDFAAWNLPWSVNEGDPLSLIHI